MRSTITILEALHPDKNIVWFRADGKRMVAKDWEGGGWMRTLACHQRPWRPEIRDSTGQAQRTTISAAPQCLSRTGVVPHFS